LCVGAQGPADGEAEIVRVDGYGESAANARAIALENAQREVEKQLQRRFARSGWLPPEDRLQPDSLQKKKVVQVEEQKELSRTAPARYKAVYRIDVNAGYLHDLEQVAREQRMLERHFLLARILAGLVVGLLVVYGYLRLEHATGGYYTRLLR